MSVITFCGDTLPPLVVTKRLTMDYEIHSTGLCKGEYVVFVHDPKGHVNGSILSDWIIDLTIPYVVIQLPDKLGAQEEAILLMDNLLAHKTDEILEMLRDTHIRQRFVKINNISAANIQAEIIKRVVAAAEKATILTRNHSSIQHNGLVSELINGYLEAAIDEIEWGKRTSELFPTEAEQT
ncbi:MAG: hypothetical protein EZS28_022069 [Streblomastix strix]|uniref:DDE-1 domain-containing protein n=1 Tax=Streblomastix strix TaxID=222440 RepID=A0A5J4VJ02_9EUKA|nr:MAG: hypothetical protein EZS28_022069 [Streblomastix strix]